MQFPGWLPLGLYSGPSKVMLVVPVDPMQLYRLTNQSITMHVKIVAQILVQQKGKKL